jgi:membrane protein DedA with SNARE-associated domain
MIINTIAACVIWAGLVFAADYAATGMNNDVVDEQFGTAAGIGIAGIAVIGVFLGKRKKA